MELAVSEVENDMVLARSIEQYPGTEVEPTSRRSSSIFKNGFRRSSTIAAAVLTIVIGGYLPGAGAFMFNTPGDGDLVTCRPINLTWTAGIPPYRLSITPSHPAGDPVTDPWARDLTQDVKDIPNTWFIWTPNFPAGLIANFDLLDNPEPFVARKDLPLSREPGPPLSVVGSPESDVEGLKVPSHADEEAIRPNDASVRVEIGDYVPPPDPIAVASLPHEGGRRKVAQDRLPTNVGTTNALADAATGAPTGPSTSVGRAALPQRRAPRFEMDGGVRLAGGALDEEVPDDIDALSDATTTLPPPYSRFYQ
ncbi:hypothetical protein C8Q77DRAFT_1155520 [Trametes polyzona]|nr:hypothetical protein C8Q77DRAFT_1155520 [Trametes polyzona]